jgi:hypothetical protein
MRQIPFFNTLIAIINKQLQNNREITIPERKIYFLSLNMTQAVITVKIDSILQEMRQITVFITYISFLDIHFTTFDTNYSFKDIFTIVITQIHLSTNKLRTITQAVITAKT